jgi:hypothetical protein
MRDFSWGAVAAIAAIVTSQGGLLIGEFAASSGLLRLSYGERLRRGLKIMVPFAATALAAVVVLIYIGLGGEEPSPLVSIGAAVVLDLMLGGSVLLTPALVLDPDPSGAFMRAAKTVWRPVGSAILGALYVAAMTGAVWLGPDQLIARGIVSESAIELARAVAGWLAMGVLAIPFWGLVTRLYVPPASDSAASHVVLR